MAPWMIEEIERRERARRSSRSQPRLPAPQPYYQPLRERTSPVPERGIENIDFEIKT
jgi:hypothetical protein